MTDALPFQGLRIVDLGCFWAAPYLTTYLGAYGADVVKVESIQRPDGFRFTATTSELGDRWFDRSLMWQATNLNKRDVTLDLGTASGKALLRQLVAEADVFVENFAVHVVEQFGLDEQALLELNPRLVVLRLPGFGLEGPWRDYVGWGNAFEQLTGLAWVTGYPDGKPQTPGGYIDPTVGMHATVAVLAALEHRDRTGEGQLVEVPQIEVGASMAAESIIAWSLRGEAPGRIGNWHPVYVPQGVYECAGEVPGWVALSVRHDADWAALLSMSECPETLHSESFASSGGRHARTTELDETLAQWFSAEDADDLVRRLVDAGIPAARVLTVDRYNEDPQLIARGFYQSVEHPLSGPRLFPRYPMHYDFETGRADTHRMPAPMLGEHTEEILCGELGLSKSEFATLVQDQVIGTEPGGV